MAKFQDLPVELALAIMKYADTPQDIFAMIRADHWLLHCFLDNRKQLMTPRAAKIMEVCGGLFSTAYLLAARLRHAKQDPRFNDPRPPHRESIVSHRASLGTICALSTLAVDIGWLTSSYMAQAREQLFKYHRRPEDWPEVSSKEHLRFINVACRFESYAQAFFHAGQPLFPRNLNIRCLLFSPSICSAESEYNATRTFYSIAYYIYDQHCTMMKNIMSSLGVKETCLIEVNKYVHYLTTQGLGMLLQLQSMTLQDQLHFVLWRFESILDSSSPNILMVEGIELYRIGTVEKHSWNPWVHCEDVFEMDSEEWKTADAFWDSG
ncbi:uncharacterized protein FPRO_10233 [Fusarium proliferatum ET1]|uniref:Uncharacterized protein n=1 Tax=Fusarium proliferatum (strain ET1) TaxID=1227346 RepID=A0A1L7VJA5_FUSPR|nr:uncharacterized protein FPRO_10233 [Fusarium proliferatum ET1]CZR40643.1 uncharacterized protein FPRO_10233 [Fusarium proliferatum ET1]